MAPLLLEPIGPFIIITVYFLPAVVANRGQAEHEISIFWVNLLLGWTMLGWLAVLLWTVAETKPRAIPESWLPYYFRQRSTSARVRHRSVTQLMKHNRVQFRRGEIEGA